MRAIPPPRSSLRLVTKPCATCRASKSLVDFHLDEHAKDGRANVCRLCARAIAGCWARTSSIDAVNACRGALVGSYMPATESGFGDVELMMIAARVWTSLGFTYAAGPSEGVTVTQRKGEPVRVRLVARDLFTGLPLIADVDPDTGRPFDMEYSE